MKYRSVRSAALFVALLAFYPKLSQSGEVRLVKDVNYGPGPAQRLDVCEPASQPLGAIVLLHGGGWEGGDKKDMPCRYFAANGLVAVGVNYSLLDGHASWPAPLNDILAALDWLDANKSKLRLARRGVCFYGVSAGGHLAAYVATVRPTASCAVDNFGPVDLTKGRFKEIVGKKFFPGQPADKAEELAQSVSVIGRINGHTPPMFIAQGYADKLVPIEQSRALEGALVKAGVPVESVYYPGGHSWEGLDPRQIEEIRKAELQFVLNHVGGQP